MDARRPGTTIGARLRRAGAGVLAVALAALGLVAGGGAALAAPGSVEDGAIRVENTSIQRVYLDAAMRSQLWTRHSTRLGAYYLGTERENPRGAEHTGPMVTTASGRVMWAGHGSLVGQEHGGTGTAADPYRIATTRELPGVMRVTKTDLYVDGDDYVQSTLSYTNLGSTAEDVQLGYWYDCYFAGSDDGTTVMEPTAASCVAQNGEGAMSVVAVSPTPVLLGGYYSTVRTVAREYGITSSCVLSDGTREACHTTPEFDNAVAILWRTAEVEPGAEVTRAWFTTVGERVEPFADLAVGATVDPPSVQVGDEVTYTLDVRDDGPAASPGTTVDFGIPAGLELTAQSGDGTYDAATGAWTVGDLASGQAAQIRLTARAVSAGTWGAAVTRAASPTVLDPSACTVESPESCGEPTTVEVSERAVTATLDAAPRTLAADGVSVSTVTLTTGAVTPEPAAADAIGAGAGPEAGIPAGPAGLAAAGADVPADESADDAAAGSGAGIPAAGTPDVPAAGAADVPAAGAADVAAADAADAPVADAADAPVADAADVPVADAAGAPAADVAGPEDVTFATDLGELDAPVVHGDGTVTVGLRSVEPGVATVRASVGGTEVGTVRVSFVAADPEPVDPQPVEPQPVDPQPVDPEPTEPVDPDPAPAPDPTVATAPGGAGQPQVGGSASGVLAWTGSPAGAVLLCAAALVVAGGVLVGARSRRQARRQG